MGWLPNRHEGVRTIKGMEMLDGKMVIGAALTAAAYTSTWIEQANEYATLALTVGGIVVAIVTVWYTIERIKDLRRKKEDTE